MAASYRLWRLSSAVLTPTSAGYPIHPEVFDRLYEDWHSQMSTTSDRYSHVVPELQREAASRMDTLLGS
jgi:hypothetical protein